MFEQGMAAVIELNGGVDTFSTRIEDVKDGYLVIATPMKQREYVRLEQGQKIMLQVQRRNNPYFFDTAVIGTIFDEGRQFVQVRRPPDNAGVSLRQHVRVNVVISDAQFWVEGSNSKFGPTVTGTVMDISAGGLQTMTKDGLPEGGLALTRMTLSRQAGHLMANVKVLRDYERTSDVGVKSHRSHCQFVDLGDKERDRLIKFVFQRERELRQKGVL
jgi:c-di-GMP-binding flagellar brake protein YcgR